MLPMYTAIMSIIRHANVQIDLSALQHNLGVVRKAAPHSKIMSVVKANAYGHGMADVVKALYESDGYSVACVNEGMLLRQHGVTKPILVLQGALNMEEYRIASILKMTLVIHEAAQLQLYREFDDKQPDLWLKVDTGMHRFGFQPEDVESAMQVIGEHCSGLMTHFSDADDPKNPKTNEQNALFDAVAQRFPLQRSAANSAAIITNRETHYDWVRPGIMLYGVTPLLGGYGKELGLRPAMTFSAPVAALKKLSAGDTVGYGSDFTCPNDMTVACVSVGYGDGYPRGAPLATPVLLNGEKCRLVGRVSMDSIVVDVSHLKECEVGDIAVLWGPDMPVEALAANLNTLSYSLLCGVA